MTLPPSSPPPKADGPPRWRSRLAFAVLGGIALVFRVLEHRVHLLAAFLPPPFADLDGCLTTGVVPCA